MAKKKHKAALGHTAGRSRDNESRAATSLDTALLADEPERSSRHHAQARRSSLYALVPALLALLTSLNTVLNGFAFDDTQQILRNEFIKRFSNLPLLFTNSVWGFNGDSLMIAASDFYYRPLFMALFTVNYAIFGETAWGWHLVNALIHAGVTLLVFFALKEVTERRWPAAIAAGLFAVHPSHAESVAWISGITDPLMALFVLPAFIFYLKYKKSGRRSFMAFSIALLLPALLSKETAIVLPLVIAYCELFLFSDGAPRGQRLRRAVTLAACFIVPTAVYFFMRYLALSHNLAPRAARFGISLVLATVPKVVVKYLGLMFIPLGYSLEHDTVPVTTFLSWGFVGPMALLIAIGAGVWLAKSRVLTFAAVWFVLWLLPPLAGLRSFEPQYFVQERYLYLPSIGVCLAIALGIEWLAAHRIFKWTGRTAAATAAVLLVMVWGGVAMAQNRVWSDTLTLLRNSVAKDPQSTMAHIVLSTEYYSHGMRKEAEAETYKALEIDPNCQDALINLSQMAANDGKLDAAIGYLERARDALGDGPQKRGYLARIYHDLGRLYDERKKPDLAEQYLKQAVEIVPYPKNWVALGDFYFDKGRYEEALEQYELARAGTSPKYALLHLKLGRTYDRLGQVERARDEYKQYLDLAPNAEDRLEVFRRLRQL
ncbi:MAG TPA: tetratricopeptide repeat protein [Blastocatellia bacterium]|nr:tetratricopeptide repeat protein [Blastocatellia bacterium]